jgi:hypothetical protein
MEYSGELLITCSWSTIFHKRRGISWPSERLLASQDGLYSMETISGLQKRRLVKGREIGLRGWTAPPTAATCRKPDKYGSYTWRYAQVRLPFWRASLRDTKSSELSSRRFNFRWHRVFIVKVTTETGKMSSCSHTAFPVSTCIASENQWQTFTSTLLFCMGVELCLWD